MINKIHAAGTYVYVIVDEPEKEMGGFQIPDSAQKKGSIGEIFSVGEAVEVKAIEAGCKKGNKAIFAPGSGIPLEVFGTDFKVLHIEKVLGYIY